MRAFIKIHGVKHISNKEAVMQLKAKVDSDGEELSVITSGTLSHNIFV